MRVLEALQGARLAGPLGRVQRVVPPQDRRDGRRGGPRLEALAGQQHAQLAGAPGGVLDAQGQHRLFHGRHRPGRTVPRAPRTVQQAAGPLRRIAVQPLVPRRRRDPEARTQRALVLPGSPGQRHKLRPQVAHPSLRKRHIPALHLIAECVNQVSEHV